MGQADIELGYIGAVVGRRSGETVLEAVRRVVEEAGGYQATQAMQDDVSELLTALGLSDHARPASPHHVVQTEILPAIRRLRGTTVVVNPPCSTCGSATERRTFVSRSTTTGSCTAFELMACPRCGPGLVEVRDSEQADATSGADSEACPPRCDGCGLKADPRHTWVVGNGHHCGGVFRVDVRVDSIDEIPNAIAKAMQERPRAD